MSVLVISFFRCQILGVGAHSVRPSVTMQLAFTFCRGRCPHRPAEFNISLPTMVERRGRRSLHGNVEQGKCRGGYHPPVGRIVILGRARAPSPTNSRRKFLCKGPRYAPLHLIPNTRYPKNYTRRYSKIYKKCAVEISKNKENF